jgi:hypothetical protein
MSDEYFKAQAKRVRDIAALADPHTKQRLLALAERYDAATPSPRRTQLPSASVAPQAGAPNDSSRSG